MWRAQYYILFSSKYSALPCLHHQAEMPVKRNTQHNLSCCRIQVNYSASSMTWSSKQPLHASFVKPKRHSHLVSVFMKCTRLPGSAARKATEWFVRRVHVRGREESRFCCWQGRPELNLCFVSRRSEGSMEDRMILWCCYTISYSSQSSR